jgi:hypothetical protein
MTVFDKMAVRKEVEAFAGGESFYRYGKTMSAMFRKESFFYSFVQTPHESSLIRTDNNTTTSGNKYVFEVFTIMNNKIIAGDQLTIAENSLIGNIARSCDLEITNIL